MITHGKRSGTVVEWRNETVEKAIEAEVDGMVKAAVAGDFSKRVPLEGKNELHAQSRHLDERAVREHRQGAATI